MGTYSAAQVTCLPEASDSGSSCSTRHSHRVMTLRHKRGAGDSPWKDLVTQGPQKKERLKAIKKSWPVIPLIAKLLPLIFTKKTGKVEGTNHWQACGFLPAVRCRHYTSCCFAHLPVAFCRRPEVWVPGRRQESCRVEAQSVSSSVSPRVPFLLSALASYHLGLHSGPRKRFVPWLCVFFWVC